MNWKLIIYLDTCIFSRLFDVTTQASVLAEAERIWHIIRNRLSGAYILVGSFAVIAEIRKNPDAKERRFIERLYNRIINDEAQKSAQVITRAARLQSMAGLGAMDAAHLAAAEAANADYLLTVDKDFIKKCSRQNFTKVKVINPINF